MDDSGSFKFFEHINHRFDLTKALIDNSVDTNSFRNLLNEKNDMDKGNSKQKTELQDKKKSEEINFNSLKDRKMAILK